MISFDERIKEGTTAEKATLNGHELTPVFSTRSVSFDYAGLAYGQQYVFSMPAGFVQDNSGNQAEAVNITFTVMERQQPAARTFNAIVDASLELGQGEKIAAICASPSVILGPLGLLDGREAVCYPGMEDGMTGAVVLNQPVAVDGNIVTGNGPAAAAKFALTIASISMGGDVAHDVAAGMLLE